MPRVWPLTIALVSAVSLAPQAQGDGGYRLVPNWPTLPAGMYFGLKDAPPPPAEREAQAAARRAMGGQRAAQSGSGGPANQPGISGVAISKDDLIYVFNRGPKPVMVFNPAGQMVMATRPCVAPPHVRSGPLRPPPRRAAARLAPVAPTMLDARFSAW